METSSGQRLWRLFAKQDVLRSRDLESQGITRAVLARYVEAGLLTRVGRGLYTRADHSPSENHTLAQVAKRVPDAVFCLLTALRFHGLTTQSPREVWIALPASARKPRLDYPKLRIARFSGAALTTGIEIQRAEGVAIRVYSPAKTVADCFKYRNKLGIDVAVEALRDFTRRHRGEASELARYARVCRVARVIQPYLDAIASA
jgi:predicted transcriptional regulator of viral defense system